MLVILDDVRIVDLSQGLAGPLATRLLAEAGADVVKVEPPGGDRMRRLNPTGFAIWNRSKRGVVLDLDDGVDRARLDALLTEADVVVHDCTPAVALARGLDDATVASRFPGLVVAAVTGWPEGHPDAERSDEDVLVQARIGLFDEVLPPDEPVFVPFPVPSLHAAHLLAAGILARLDLRMRRGLVGPVRTSIAQGAFANLTMLWNRAEHADPALGPRLVHPLALTSAQLCGDGEYVVQGIGAIPELLESLAALDPPGSLEVNEDRLRALQTRAARDWVLLFGRAGGMCMEVLRPGAVITHPQSVANGFAVEVDDPVFGHTVQAGPALAVEPACAVRSGAPELDPAAHAAFAGARVAWPTPDGASPPGSPLEGLKVLDLGMFLAGPFAPQCLADLGADVIKVEPPGGDRMRGMSQLFVGCQRNKRSIELDLKDPASRPVLERLVRWADVVHHNQRRPAAAALGLDEASLRAINPDIIFSHTSTYGPDGEMADWPGVDHDGAAASGWMWDCAGAGNIPLWVPWGWADFECALSSLVATLLAVFHRDRTGEAGSVTASIMGAAATSTDRLVLADGRVSPGPQLDADRKGVSLERRMYATSDGWVVVVADRAGGLDALRAVAGGASDDELPDAFRDRPAAEVADALRDVGVPNEVVTVDGEAAFHDDPDLRRLRYTVEYPHPQWGRFEQPGAYWGFGDLSVRLDAPPPLLGQHSTDVLLEVGFTTAEVDDLLRGGAVRSYSPPTPV